MRTRGPTRWPRTGSVSRRTPSSSSSAVACPSQVMAIREAVAVAATLIAALNAVLPPLVAALRLPFTLALGFVAALVLDPIILLLASKIDPHSFKVDGFGWALLASLVIGVVSLVLEVIVGVDN